MSLMKRRMEEQSPEPSRAVDTGMLARSLVARANAQVPAYLKCMTIAELRVQCRDVAARRPVYPGKDWADRLLARIQSGERLPVICESMARRAIELPSAREPGQDDE